MDLEHQEWIRLCVTEHQQALVAYSVKFLGDVSRAQDIVQEAFIRLCREPREKIVPRERQWLFTVCRNLAMDILRKEKKMTQLDQDMIEKHPSPEPSPADGAENREEGQNLLSLLERLPANQREAIRLKFLHDMSYKEISDVTGLSVGNVGFLIHTGLKQMRTRLSTGTASA